MLPTVQQYFANLVAFQGPVTPPLYWALLVIGLSWGLWHETRLHVWLLALFVAHTLWTLSIFSNVPYNLRSQLLPEVVMVLMAP
jgi:hypothetical protein